MIIWLLLLSSFSFAQDPAIEEYCFRSEAKKNFALEKTRFILVPADKIQSDRACFTVSTPPHRRELIQNYVRRLDPDVAISFSSAEIKREPCRLKVEKIRTIQQEALNGSINTNQNIAIGQEQLVREQKDTSSIQTIKEFELSVNQDRILGECRSINPDRYEVTLQVLKEARPLLPPLPPGTTVIVPDAQLPSPQETSSLTTTLQLNRGQRVEIGSVIKDLKDKNHNIDLKNGASGNLQSGTEQDKIFLSLE